ncbi:Ig-like domain-containing protein [Nocardioides sp. SR21]|uniref:Ig-like domain-containing protein n=1 Tax=Nocardioides sp. SR21 TaxID=2919501 RepID=UPI001FA9B37F|nr:Ig-like domain-containing protein [Nocardioides sp. SR21]
MKARALTTLVALTLGITLATTSPALADEVDPQAPVVVDDAITVWPGESREIDVLTNDSDPTGDDLAVCRLPGFDIVSSQVPAVYALDMSVYGFPAGRLLVSSDDRTRGTHTIDYYVCSRTRLTPATLTVTVRPVSPVAVTKVAGRPGVLKVTNTNDQAIRFRATDRTGCRQDGRVRVPAHDSRVVRVERHDIAWTAYIGNGGVADRGRLRGIELAGPSAPQGPRGSGCSISIAAVGGR